MRCLLALLVVCSPWPASCQKAAALTNDQMAQCAGAMGLEHEYIVHQSSPRYDLLPPLSAGIAYFQYKLKSAGVSDHGRAGAMAFVNANFRNHELVGRMVASCGHKLWADKEFTSHYNELIHVAIEHDPACKWDPSRCLKR